METEAKPITAAGGVLIRNHSASPEVLLIYRNGNWDLPKGRREGSESIETCAVREVEEETGASGISTESFLCTTYHEYRENGTLWGKTTHWYLMKTGEKEQELTPETEEGITRVVWTEIEEARKRVHYENLVRVLDRVREERASE